MAQLIGKIYNLEVYLKDKEGKQIAYTPDNFESKLEVAEKATLQCTIGTKRAFKSDDENEKLHFIEVVAFQKRLVRNMYIGFNNQKGKPAVLYGNFNDREWTPDVNKAEHRKYCRKETLYREDLEGLGFKFAEGSKEKVSFYVPVPQTVKQLVLNNFEFIDADFSNNNNSSSESTAGKRSNVAFVSDDEDIEALSTVGSEEPRPF